MRLLRNRVIVTIVAVTMVCGTTATAQAGVFPWLWNVFFGPPNAPMFPRIAARRQAAACCGYNYAPPAPSFASYSPPAFNYAPAVSYAPPASYAPQTVSYAPAMSYAPAVSYAPSMASYAPTGCCGVTSSYAPSVYSEPLALSGTIVGDSYISGVPMQYSGYVVDSGCGTPIGTGSTIVGGDVSYPVSDPPEKKEDDTGIGSDIGGGSGSGGYEEPGIGAGSFKAPGSSSSSGSDNTEDPAFTRPTRPKRRSDGLGGGIGDGGDVNFDDLDLDGGDSGTGGMFRGANKPVSDAVEQDRKAPADPPAESKRQFESRLGLLDKLDRDSELKRVASNQRSVSLARNKKRPTFRWISVPNNRTALR